MSNTLKHGYQHLTIQANHISIPYKTKTNQYESLISLEHESHLVSQYITIIPIHYDEYRFIQMNHYLNLVSVFSHFFFFFFLFQFCISKHVSLIFLCRLFLLKSDIFVSVMFYFYFFNGKC